MRGGFKTEQNTAVAQDPKVVERLKKEIKELTTKKSNLNAEINKAIAVKIKELEEKYDKKVSEVISEHTAKMNKLETVKTELEKIRVDLIAKDKTIIEANKLLDKRETDVVEKERKAEELRLLYQGLMDGSGDKFKKQQQEFDSKVASIVVREENLKGKEKEVEDLKINTMQANREIAAKIADAERKNAEADEKISIAIRKEETVDRLIEEKRTANEEILLLKKQAESELKEAKAVKKEAVDGLAKILKDKEANSKLSANLQSFQESLLEQEKTLKESKRVIILKNREIDKKIKTLKQLREANNE